MNDPPRLQPALGYRVARGGQLRSTSDSPTRQRPADDLISRVTPRKVVEAFRKPSGELKRCVDAAPPSEQAFGMRVAVASEKIEEWLEELSAWPWPTDDASAGFKSPPTKRQTLFSEYTLSKDNSSSGEGDIADERKFLGSLLATEVTRYERRAYEIKQDMEALDIDEIENHILHHHIMPLSRPGTPISSSLRSGAFSASAYVPLDDFTALITQTIVQALPNLSKLGRLLNTWNIRLLVLQKSALFLTALMDAGIALEAGRKAMETRPDKGSGDLEQGQARSSASVLSRGDFSIMKLVVERKIAKAGQHLDYMLDILEGSEDTLPEDWIDRMDSIEREYAEWAATCERQIREAEWAKIVAEARTTQDTTEGTTTASIQSPEDPSSTKESNDGVAPDHSPLSGTVDGLRALKGFDTVPTTTQSSNQFGCLDPETEHEHEVVARNNADLMPNTPVIKIHPADQDYSAVGQPNNSSQGQQPRAALDDDVSSKSSAEQLHGFCTGSSTQRTKNEAPKFDRFEDTGSFVHNDVSETTADLHRVQLPADSTEPAIGHMPVSNTEQTRVKLVENGHSGDDDDVDSDIEFPDSGFPEPELPVLPQQRRESDASNTSTVVHGLHSTFASLSSDLPDVGTPDYRRLRDVALPSTEVDDANIADDASLPSSPPDFRSSTRSVSVSFNDIPTVVEAPEEGTPPETPLDASFADNDELPLETGRYDSPSKMSVASTDDHLQQQISEILESIPAKIKLSSEPSAINLNPPDFTMPTTARPKAKHDPFPRSYSSMSNRSSRAGTPSFTLAPAKNSRPRHQRGNQEIKLYHLSRSNGEPPIKLFIRCVGENGERVMVRVGGGWADLGEYLKEYASHHGRRSGGEGKVEIRDVPRISTASRAGSSPPSRPASAMDLSSPVTPLNVRKARRSIGASASEEVKGIARQPLPKTPLANSAAAPKSSDNNTSSSGGSSRSRSSSRLSWTEEDSSLGMAGPKAKQVEMSEESKAWVESVKEKVRIASGDQRAALAKSPAIIPVAPDQKASVEGKFGELGKVGATKRLFRRQVTPGAGPAAGK